MNKNKKYYKLSLAAKNSIDKLMLSNTSTIPINQPNETLAIVSTDGSEVSSNRMSVFCDNIPVKIGDIIHWDASKNMTCSFYYYKDVKRKQEGFISGISAIGISTCTYTVERNGFINICVRTNDSAKLTAQDMLLIRSGLLSITSNRKDIKTQIDDIENDLYVSQWNGRKWFAYGTSATNPGTSNDTIGKYVDVISSLSGLKCTNKGLNGGSIAGTTSNDIKPLVCNTTDGKLTADLITIEVTANDVATNVGGITDSWDDGQETFSGALNKMIRYLKTNVPNARIILLTTMPTPVDPVTGIYNGKQYANTFVNAHVLRKAAVDIARFNSIPCIDAGSNCGMGYCSNMKYYASDNMHPSLNGASLYGNYVWGQLKNIPLMIN